MSYLFGMNIDQGSFFDGDFGLEASGRIELGKQNNSWAYLFSYEYGRYLSGINSSRKNIDLSIAFSSNNHYRIVFSAGKNTGEYDLGSYFQLSYRYYF